jgi:hypothetical protein
MQMPSTIGMSSLILSIYFMICYANEGSLPWKTPQTSSESNFASLHDLLDRQHLLESNYSCLSNAAAAGHSVNRIHSYASSINDTDQGTPVQMFGAPQASSQLIRGYTVWINEHMAVGHAMYDIYLIQLLQLQHIDRIVLQRAPCVNRNLCMGVGTWDGWYEGFYNAIIDAFQPGLPVYLRWVWQEKRVTPMYLSKGQRIEKPAHQIHDLPFIELQNNLCFERVYSRRCNLCFRGSISPSTVQAFKAAAYNIVNLKTNSHLADKFDSSEKLITITFAHRGLDASRHILNPELMTATLEESLPNGEFSIRMFNSSDPNTRYQEQIALVGSSHIVIAEHGAFQSNMIYMRNHSLFIELRGTFNNGHEYSNFEALASMFGILYATTTTSGLTYYAQDEFNITKEECQRVVEVVKAYAAAKPFQPASVV